MRKKLLVVFSAVLVILSLCACGSSQYDRDLDSGLDKFTSGNGGSMSKSEKRAVNDFLEWQAKQ